MGKFIQEFKDFAMKGNVLDMAIGVVIGGAFGKIVTSLVNDIIMPGVGVLTGGLNFTDYKFVIQKGVTDGTEVITPEVAITWGSFVQTVVDFLIIAFCIFLAVKAINRLKRKKEEPAPAAPAGPTQEELLIQIRDLLKEQNSK
jgi:large conductance mechanosensitive channel